MSRVQELARWLPDERTAALITSPVSLRFLCGGEIHEGIALVFRENSFLFVPESDLRQLPKTEGFTVRSAESTNLLDLLVKYGIKKLFTESDKMTVAQLNAFKEQLYYAEFITDNRLPRQLLMMRMVKTETELAAVKKAARICDRAYERTLGALRSGMTERQAAAMLNLRMGELGADEPAFPTVVLSGENTSNLRLRPSDRRFSPGDFVLIEFGARYRGYCASMSRTVAVGEISPAMDNVYNAVACAVTDGLRAIREGVGGNVPDSVAKSTLNAWRVSGSSDFGHGTGLDFSEPPYPGQGFMLKRNMTLNAGIYVGGRFGVKISDTAIVTENGSEDLMNSAKSLIHI